MVYEVIGVAAKTPIPFLRGIELFNADSQSPQNLHPDFHSNHKDNPPEKSR
jgi:hypothetical protein